MTVATTPDKLRRLHRIFYSTATSILTDAAASLEDYASQLDQLKTENERLRAVLIRDAEEASREYTEAMMRGEEPHYPQWADELLKGANNE